MMLTCHLQEIDPINSGKEERKEKKRHISLFLISPPFYPFSIHFFLVLHSYLGRLGEGGIVQLFTFSTSDLKIAQHRQSLRDKLFTLDHDTVILFIIIKIKGWRDLFSDPTLQVFYPSFLSLLVEISDFPRIVITPVPLLLNCKAQDLETLKQEDVLYIFSYYDIKAVRTTAHFELTENQSTWFFVISFKVY